jgi:hypothetical protein
MNPPSITSRISWEQQKENDHYKGLRRIRTRTTTDRTKVTLNRHNGVPAPRCADTIEDVSFVLQSVRIIAIGLVCTSIFLLTASAQENEGSSRLTTPSVQCRVASPPREINCDSKAKPHQFFDRTNILLFSGVAVSRTLDYTSTRNMLARGRQEILIPDDVVYSTPGFVSLEVAGAATSIGISYLLHRTGHHKLERWLSIGHIGVTSFGAARNYALESKHP